MAPGAHRRPSLGHVGEHVALLRAIVDREADHAAELAAVHVAHIETDVRALFS